MEKTQVGVSNELAAMAEKYGNKPEEGSEKPIEPTEPKPEDVVVEEKPTEPKEPEKPIDPKKPEEPVTVNYEEQFGEGILDVNIASSKYRENLGLIESLRASEIALKDQVAELNKSSIDDPDLFKLNKIKKDNPDEYSILSKLVINKDALNDLDLVKLDFLKKNPQFKDKQEDMELYLKKKFKLDLKPHPEGEDSDYEPDEINERKEQIKIGGMELNLAANSVRSEYLSKLDGIDIPVHKTVEEVQAGKDQSKSDWTPIVNQMMGNFTKIPLFRSQKDGESVKFMDYEIPDNLKVGLADKVLKYVVDNGLPADKDSFLKAATFLVNSFTENNSPAINNAIMSNAHAMTDKEWEEKVNNPSALVSKKTVADPGDDKHEQSRQKVKAAFGLT